MTEYSSAQALKDHADHFGPRNWDWTRNIDFDVTFRQTKKQRKGARRLALKSFFERKPDLFFPQKNPWRRLKLRYYHAKAHLTMHYSNPDGRLTGASVAAWWEEDGEYIQLVQPTVGSLLADFLLEEPDHPHAKKISAEIDRIRARYAERWKSGEVDGRTHE